MTLHEIVTNPEFAGLHWEIPRDTPPEDRERAHISAAYAAKSRRDREHDRTLIVLYKDVSRNQIFILWPNGSKTLESLSSIYVHYPPYRLIYA